VVSSVFGCGRRLRGSGAAWEDVASEMGGTSQSRRMQFSRAIDRVAQQLGLDLTG